MRERAVAENRLGIPTEGLAPKRVHTIASFEL